MPHVMAVEVTIDLGSDHARTLITNTSHDDAVMLAVYDDSDIFCSQYFHEFFVNLFGESFLELWSPAVVFDDPIELG